MKKSKAPSKKSAPAQPKPETKRPLAPWSLISYPVPYQSKECHLVAEWEAYDGTWEQLLVNDRKDVFFLASSFGPEEPPVITTSEALYWYATKRHLECDFGDFSWPNIDLLLVRAVNEIQYAEEVIGKRPIETVDDTAAEGGAK